MANNSREACANDIINYMAALDPTKSKSITKWNSSSSRKISEPYVEHLVTTSPNPTNSNVG